MKRLFVMIGFALLVGSCGGGEQRPVLPVELTDESVCALDGMLLADYPGPRAQIHYAQGAPELYSDTVEMFAIYLGGSQARKIVALYVQDMGAAGGRTTSLETRPALSDNVKHRQGRREARAFGYNFTRAGIAQLVE